MKKLERQVRHQKKEADFEGESHSIKAKGSNGGALRRYTFFVEAEGGTFISQVLAPSLTEAGQLWLVDWSERYPLSDVAREESESALDEHDFWVPLHGLTNVWCAGFTVGGEHVDLINVVETAP